MSSFHPFLSLLFPSPHHLFPFPSSLSRPFIFLISLPPPPIMPLPFSLWQYTIHTRCMSTCRLPAADPSSRIWLDEVACTSGSDVSIVQCRHEEFGVHNCNHSQDIALQCRSSDVFTRGCERTIMYGRKRTLFHSSGRIRLVIIISMLY